MRLISDPRTCRTCILVHDLKRHGYTPGSYKPMTKKTQVGDLLVDIIDIQECFRDVPVALR
jgi:hypothetical protein